MNERIAKVKAMADELLALFPGARTVELSRTKVDSYETCDLVIHGPKKYEQAVELLRGLGIGRRAKQVFNNFTLVSGVADGVTVKTYPDELPPTCHMEKFIERVPKTKTVEVGEFIEVERERIVCGKEDSDTEIVPA